MSVLLGLLATLVSVMAIVGGWFLGVLIVDWLIKIGPTSIVVGCAVTILFLFLTRYFYEHVIIEEGEE